NRSESRFACAGAIAPLSLGSVLGQVRQLRAVRAHSSASWSVLLPLTRTFQCLAHTAGHAGLQPGMQQLLPCLARTVRGGGGWNCKQRINYRRTIIMR